MLLVSRSLDFWKMTCIASLCSCDKMSFPPFSVFSFILQLPISSSFSQNVKELLSSSSYLFYMPSFLQWYHERGNFVLRIYPIQLAFYAGYCSPVRLRTSLVTFFDHFNLSILLQHHFSKSRNTSSPVFLLCRSQSHTM